MTSMKKLAFTLAWILALIALAFILDWAIRSLIPQPRVASGDISHARDISTGGHIPPTEKSNQAKPDTYPHRLYLEWHHALSGRDTADLACRGKRLSTATRSARDP